MKKFLGLMLLISACSDSTATKPDAGGIAKDAAGSFEGGTELRIPVPEMGRVYVKLAPPSIVTPSSPPEKSLDWDLVFEGFDIYTNSGASGVGKGGSFGPLDVTTFFADTAPSVPFLAVDEPGGAFLRWYAYSGTNHALLSRYHVYGVRDGNRTFKLQILGYYGKLQGAPVSAIYSLRWADLDAPNDVKTLTDIDGTAGGLNPAPAAPSECLDLGTGARTMLAPADARMSSAWHLCFRRDAIYVNGELGGPRGVGAVNLRADQLKTEKLTDVEKRTADSSKPEFDMTSAASFDGKVFRGDRIVSGLADWLDRSTTPVTLTDGAWLLAGAAGQKFLLGFSRLENPTTRSPGTVVLIFKPVKG